MTDERVVDLWEYLPPFLKKFKEFEKLLAAEQPEFQELIKERNQLLDNLFIETADSEGLKKYENLLKIYPNPDDSLELRRKNVLSKWFSADIYTMKTLLQRLVLLQGNEDVQLVWDEDDAFALHVITDLEERGQVDTLAQILEMMVPANIEILSENIFAITAEIPTGVSVGTNIAGSLFLTNDLPASDFQNEMNLYYSAGMSMTDTQFITD